jgi:nitroreductase
MEFETVVRRRRMVRAYDPDRAVSRETIDHLIELATHAPSAGFSQGWHFLVLDNPESIGRFWAATTDGSPADTWLTGMQQAPTLILALSDKQVYLARYAEDDKGWVDQAESHWPVPYWDIDTGMAAMLILLGVVDAGLSACFFGIQGERWPAVFRTFGIPESMRPIGVISVGYAAPDRRSPSLKRGRRGADQIVSYGQFGAVPL